MKDIYIEKRKERLIGLMNRLAKIEPSIYCKCCHEVIGTEYEEVLIELEKEYPELGLYRREPGEKFRVTFPSLLATVTDILCGERICFNVNNKHLSMTEGFGWWRIKSSFTDCTPSQTLDSEQND